MNFQPKFNSGRSVDGSFLPVAPKPEPELTKTPPDPREIRSLILRMSLIGFVTALASRATDPIIPPIAHDIQVDPNAVALLTTAFALPFALVQPILGPVGDMVGKVRVMMACLAITIVAMLVSGLATNFTTLMVARVVAGAAAGGIFPIGIAVIGDLVPVKDRQVAIARWLVAVITGNLLGASLSGVVGDLLGWRGVFYVITGLGVVALVVAIVSLRKAARAQKATGLSLSGFSRGYGSVFANPRAKICFGAVFVEGIVIFGLFPFVALMLHAAGETRASIAGVVIAGFSLGGVVYALGVPMMVARWRPDQLMIGGGILAAISLAVVAFNVPWQVQIAAFTLLGLGFYTMHASIQVHRDGALQHGARRRDVAARVLLLRWARDGPDPLRRGLREARYGDHPVARGGDCTRDRPRDRTTSARSFVRLGRLISASCPIGRHALVRHPDILRLLAVLPEHVDRHAAARIEIAADAQPLRREQFHDALADRDRAVLVEGAVIAEAVEIKLQRLRLDEPAARHVVDHHDAEVGLAGDRADRGEFRKREPRDVIRVGLRIRHAVEHRLVGRGGQGARLSEQFRVRRTARHDAVSASKSGPDQ